MTGAIEHCSLFAWTSTLMFYLFIVSKNDQTWDTE